MHGKQREINVLLNPSKYHIKINGLPIRTTTPGTFWWQTAHMSPAVTCCETKWWPVLLKIQLYDKSLQLLVCSLTAYIVGEPLRSGGELKQNLRLKKIEDRFWTLREAEAIKWKSGGDTMKEYVLVVSAWERSFSPPFPLLPKAAWTTNEWGEGVNALSSSHDYSFTWKVYDRLPFSQFSRKWS